MNFIKRVFDGEVDESVHAQFQKFSRGEFKDRAIIRVKKSRSKYTISTTSEFANEFVRTIAEKLGDDKTKITGAIVSTLDLTGDLDFKEKKQFQGVKRYLIEKEMSGKEILNILEKYPKAFFALSFESGKGDVLKIKAKAPKSAKPKNKDEAPVPDFCKLVTNDKSILNSFIFEDKEFKEANISHTFIINEIVVPEELKKEKDFALIREKSLRKGKIIREVNIDGLIVKEEKDFEA